MDDITCGTCKKVIWRDGDDDLVHECYQTRIEIGGRHISVRHGEIFGLPYDPDAVRFVDGPHFIMV